MSKKSQSLDVTKISTRINSLFLTSSSKSSLSKSSLSYFAIVVIIIDDKNLTNNRACIIKRSNVTRVIGSTSVANVLDRRNST